MTLATTIGSADDEILSYWEAEAPTFKERLDCLKLAYNSTYRTSVSSEPMLDTGIHKVVTAVKPFVTDSVWLGRVNLLANALANNCPKDVEAKRRAKVLLSEQTDEWVWKLYDRYRADMFIRWKDSLKKVLGMERPTATGLDV